MATSITSNYIVDSRLDKHVIAKGNLFNCFVGVWLESSTALFDSSCVGLMEQMTVTNDGALRLTAADGDPAVASILGIEVDPQVAADVYADLAARDRVFRLSESSFYLGLEWSVVAV